MTSACLTDVKEYLRETIPRGQTVYYYPNPGNAGDALIAQATFQMLDDLGTDYQEIRGRRFDGTDKVILYGGGGNLTAHYPHSTLGRLLRENHRRCRRFIILPHTISGHAALMGELGRNVCVFLREMTSYEYVLEACSGPEVLLADDLALELDVADLLRQERRFLPVLCNTPGVRLRLGVMKRFLNIVRLEALRPKGESVSCMRTDIERSSCPANDPNYDVSNLFQFGTTREGSFYSASRMLSFLNHYTHVRTNRLHVCIAAALLGKQVAFSANSYYKCRAVYEFSLRDRFPNVIWSDPS